ncbi:MAG: thioredoxin family protein [Candidatus Woesearchaeota archaeon]|jgi:ribonucleoside-triphosphate reductase|nr:thioredoxin family protein [Candidatus Woesearchaeota archaeon]MDP7506240.1 thioredoxin family protein [Candidatus Woesearchaeota archaeon]MDP7610710.1 thioredoxin family protein [Candidatus Woesearchaeota archaeon]
MIKNYKLFFTPMCPNCPSVKEFMKTVDIEGKEIDATSEEGMAEARNYDIMSVPTILFFDEKEELAGRATSIDEIKRLIENKSLGDIN